MEERLREEIENVNGFSSLYCGHLDRLACAVAYRPRKIGFGEQVPDPTSTYEDSMVCDEEMPLIHEIGIGLDLAKIDPFSLRRFVEDPTSPLQSERVFHPAARNAGT